MRLTEWGLETSPIFFVVVLLFLISCAEPKVNQEFGRGSEDQLTSAGDQNLPESVRVNGPAAEFTLQDQRGLDFQLSAFKGNFVLLNFWATWCPPCIEELPSMDALNSLFKSKAFSMIAISVDDSWAEIDSFLNRLSRRPSFLILHDPGKRVATGLYGTEKFPETYLIGPDGKILKKYAGSVAWMSPEVVGEISAFMENYRSP